MRDYSLHTAIAAGLLITGSMAPALAQSAYRDAKELPCNEFCQAWMNSGPPANRSDDGPMQVAPFPEAAAKEPVERPRVHAATTRPEPRSVVRVHSRGGFGRRWTEPDEFTEHKFDPPRLRATVRAASAPASLPAREIAKPVAVVPRPVVAKKVDADAKDSGSTVATDPSTGPSVRLSPDAKTLTLTVGGARSEELQLTVAQADQVVQSIGAARARMQPQPQQNWAFQQTVSTIYDPRWTTEAERSKGDSVLHIRDPRYGWLHYTMPRATAQQLGSLLKKQATLPLARERRAEKSP